MTNVLVVDDQEQFLDLLTPMLKAKMAQKQRSFTPSMTTKV